MKALEKEIPEISRENSMIRQLTSSMTRVNVKKLMKNRIKMVSSHFFAMSRWRNFENPMFKAITARNVDKLDINMAGMSEITPLRSAKTNPLSAVKKQLASR
jgi:hypothetical protein